MAYVQVLFLCSLPLLPSPAQLRERTGVRVMVYRSSIPGCPPTMSQDRAQGEGVWFHNSVFLLRRSRDEFRAAPTRAGEGSCRTVAAVTFPCDLSPPNL